MPSTPPNQTMIRGKTPSFRKNIDDDEQPPPSPPPLGRSKKKTSNHNNSNKNPYSARGLDKFSTVLGELEARRTRIIERAGAAGAGVSMVKFAYSNSSDDWIPLVVRQRSEPKDGNDTTAATKKQQPRPPSPPPPASSPPQPTQGVLEELVAPLPAAAVKGRKVIEKTNGFLKGLGVEEVKEWMRRKWRDDRRSCYWGLVMVLVLFCLVAFGRVFAICCMLVCWYLVPVVHGEGWNVNGHGRRTSNTTTANAYGRLVAHSSSLSKKNKV